MLCLQRSKLSEDEEIGMVVFPTFYFELHLFRCPGRNIPTMKLSEEAVIGYIITPLLEMRVCLVHTELDTPL